MRTAPPAEATAPPGAAYRIGRAVYPLRDGTSCRQILFDNQTGAMSAGEAVACERAGAKPESELAAAQTLALPRKRFTWGR